MRSASDRHQRNIEVLKEALQLSGQPEPLTFNPRPKTMKMHKDQDFIFSRPGGMKPFDHSRWSDPRSQDALLIYETAAIFYHYHDKLSVPNAIKAAHAYIKHHKPTFNPCFGKVKGTCPKGFPPELCPCDPKTARKLNSFPVDWAANAGTIRTQWQQGQSILDIAQGLNNNPAAKQMASKLNAARSPSSASGMDVDGPDYYLNDVIGNEAIPSAPPYGV
jgi:hypothetical protein